MTRPVNPYDPAERPTFLPGDKVCDRRDVTEKLWRITRRIEHNGVNLMTLRAVDDRTDERTMPSKNIIPYLRMVTECIYT